MADVPDIPTTIAGIDKLKAKLEELKAAGQWEILGQALSKFRKEIENINEKMKEAKGHPEEIRKLARELDIAERSAIACANAMGGFKIAMDEATESAEEFKTKIGAVGAVFEKVVPGGHPMLSLLDGLADKMKEGGKTAGGLGAALLVLGNDFTRGMVDPLGSAEKMVAAFGTTATRLNEVWQHQADLTATVNKSVLGFGGSLMDAAKKAPLFEGSVASISATIGMSKDKVGEWMKAMLEVPGAAQAIGERVGFAGGKIEQFGQQIMLANAAGYTQQQVQDLANTMFQNFGQRTVPEVNASLALFKTLADETKQPVKDIADQITKASTPFGIFGNQLKETAGLWKAFADGMKGLPITEIGKMVDTVAGKIATMDLNTQAFVAQMSGMARGASALGGALRMELEMRDPAGGGAARNLERTIQAITSMTGGRVITLQQATQTPALEMQFQMQRNLAGQMLGVTGGAQQSRLLEVLQGVQEGGISNVDATKNIAGLMETGKSAQEQSVTLLNRIATSVGGLPELSEALKKLGAAPRRDIERAGRAIGATEPGHLSDVKNMRMMGRYFADAGQQFVSAVTPSMNRFYNQLTTRFSAIATGSRSKRRREEWTEEHTAPGGAPTDVRAPWRTQPEMRGATLPFAVRRDDPYSAVRPEFQPPNYSRPTLRGPAGETETGRPGRPGEPRVAGPAAEPEAFTAQPFIPENIKVEVVCSECRHKLGEKFERTIRKNNGDVYE